MNSINVTDLRNHLPEYLKKVKAGEARKREPVLVTQMPGDHPNIEPGEGVGKKLN